MPKDKGYAAGTKSTGSYQKKTAMGKRVVAGKSAVSKSKSTSKKKY